MALNVNEICFRSHFNVSIRFSQKQKYDRRVFQFAKKCMF